MATGRGSPIPRARRDPAWRQEQGQPIPRARRDPAWRQDEGQPIPPARRDPAWRQDEGQPIPPARRDPAWQKGEGQPIPRARRDTAWRQDQGQPIPRAWRDPAWQKGEVLLRRRPTTPRNPCPMRGCTAARSLATPFPPPGFPRTLTSSLLPLAALCRHVRGHVFILLHPHGHLHDTVLHTLLHAQQAQPRSGLQAKRGACVHPPD
eukprot:359622-Chlamydomonas_euryale.AAC.9